MVAKTFTTIAVEGRSVRIDVCTGCMSVWVGITSDTDSALLRLERSI